jgi:flagellar motor switch protein FliG
MKYVYADFFGLLFDQVANRLEENPEMDTKTVVRSIASLRFVSPSVMKILQ